MNATMLPYYSLEDSLNSLSFNSEIAYQYCLLTINSNCVSIIKTSEGLYKVFDPHSRDTYGIPDPNGKCVLVSIDSIGNLVTYFQNTIPVRSVTPFEIKGVTVELMAFESVAQTDTSGQKGNTNRASYKRQQTTESASHKQARLKMLGSTKRENNPRKKSEIYRIRVIILKGLTSQMVVFMSKLGQNLTCKSLANPFIIQGVSKKF